MINKFKIYFLALIINLSFNQLNSQEPLMNRSNATNHTWLQKLSFYDINIEGSPYLNKNFKETTLNNKENLVHYRRDLDSLG